MEFNFISALACQLRLVELFGTLAQLELQEPKVHITIQSVVNS